MNFSAPRKLKRVNKIARNAENCDENSETKKNYEGSIQEKVSKLKMIKKEVML